MKTKTLMTALLFGSSLAIALNLMTAPTVLAQEKGAQKLMQLKPIKTSDDIDALKIGDAVVMSCAKCKTISVAYLETVKGHIQEEKSKTEHLCPGCETKIETKGFGKAAKDSVSHVCKKCGSKDVMCCILKKGSGPTKGMEEK